MAVDTQSINALLAKAEVMLSGTDSARLDAEILLASALGQGRAYLYSDPQRQITPAVEADFMTLLRSRLMGMPVAYLTGHRAFWSFDLAVSTDTLIPRPETEHVVEAALDKFTDDASWHCLDLGTGCGAIALAIALERPSSTVTATDISRETLAVARVNARTLGVANIAFVESDWFTRLAGQVFDVIVCNPPYVESNDPIINKRELRFEPRIALDGGYLGLQHICSIVASAPRHLVANGSLILEHGADQAVAVHQIFADAGFQQITTHRDLAGHQRVTQGTKQ